MFFEKAKIKTINAYKNILYSLARKLEQISFFLYQKATRVRNVNSNSIRKISAELAQSGKKAREAILNRARTYSSSVPKEFSNLKEIVELYFIVKQSVIFYDAKVNSLPTQVFNELRNALDHFIRSLILLDENGNVSEDESRRAPYIESQLLKMQGHLQRALLDITKLGCGKIDEKITKDHQRFGNRAVARANNGEYAIDIFSLLDNAEKLLIDARNEEANLGGNNDLSVRNKFIDAFSAYVAAYDYHASNIPKLWWSRSTLYIYATYALSLSILIKLTYDVFSYTPYFKRFVMFLVEKLLNIAN